MLTIKGISRLLALVMIASTIACSPKPVEKGGTKIIQHEVNYYVRYLQEEGKLRAEATFFPVDTTVEKIGQELVADVTFDGKAMQVFKVPNRGIRYIYIVEQQEIGTPAYEIAYSNGTTLKHPVSIGLLDTFWVSPVSLSKGFTLSWEGEKLESEETLVLLLTDSEGHTIPMNRINGSDGPSIKIIPPQIEKASKGKGTLSLVRKKPSTIVEDGLTIGNIVSEYYAKPIEIEIIE